MTKGNKKVIANDHHVTKPVYHRLVDRLNRFPQGAPPSTLLEKILGILFSEKEAAIVSQLPIKPFKVKNSRHLKNISQQGKKDFGSSGIPWVRKYYNKLITQFQN